MFTFMYGSLYYINALLYCTLFILCGYLCNVDNVISGEVRRHFDETARSETVGTRSGFYGFNLRITLNARLSSTSFGKWTHAGQDM